MEKNKKEAEDILLKVVQKSQKLMTVREETFKMRSQSLNPEKIGHRERLIKIKKMKDLQARRLQNKVTEGLKMREEQVERNSNFLREENERRKEVKYLHKIDQQEILSRKKAFEQMSQENRVQMILEKATRVQKNAHDIR